MKTSRSITLAAIMFIFAFALAQSAEMKEAKIKTNATCGHCKGVIEAAVNKLSGVDKCELDLSTKELKVKYDESKITIDTIRKAISKAGYDADDVKADKKAARKNPKSGGHK